MVCRLKPFGLFREATMETCSNCDGAGHFMWGDALAIYADPCGPCDGTGRRLVFTSERS